MVHHLSVLSLFLITALPTISASQNAGQIPHAALFPRVPSYGGYSLQAQPCPAGLTTCPSSKCCPANTFCHIVAAEAGYACCPDGNLPSHLSFPLSWTLLINKTWIANNCVAAVLAAPACADDSWVLWKSGSGYFCCTKDQIGIKPGKGESGVGFCVASNVPVSATQSATRVRKQSFHSF